MKVVRKVRPGIRSRQFRQEFFGLLPGHMAVHLFQDSVGDVLQRDVQIGQHFGVSPRHEVDEFLRIVGRMSIEQPDYEVAFQRIQGGQHSGQRVAGFRAVIAVDRDILSDHQQFPHSAFDQVGGLPGPPIPSAGYGAGRGSRNAAIGTAVVAAVRDFQIGEVRQGELQARRAVVVKINRFFRILRKRCFGGRAVWRSPQPD